jgi:hypothetical protein
MTNQNQISNATMRPWKVSQGTNGFCKTWQVSHESELRSQTVSDCGAVIDMRYVGSTNNFVGERENANHRANAALIVRAMNEYDALCAVAEAAKKLPRWIGKAIADGAFDDCVTPNAANVDCQSLHEAFSTLATLRNNK